MKISKMLQREDFYSILEATLNKNSTLLGIKGKVGIAEPSVDSVLFINPRLNAIISCHPSKRVKKFLFTEFTVSGSFLRRLAVYLYVWMSTTFVRWFADKGMRLSFDGITDVNELMIYPCNKKIRFFDFKKGTVITCLKDGFPANYINREMHFRSSTSSPFVPRVYNCIRNVAYEETIIQGTPLARVQDEEKRVRLLDKAYRLMRSLSSGQERKVVAKDYIESLCAKCLDELKGKEGFNNMNDVRTIFDTLGRNVDGEFNLVLSHGDFQAGNIWVSSDTNVVIIDWETVKERSPFYDYVAMYCELRMDPSKQALWKRIMSNKELPLIFNISSESMGKVVLAEDLAYQTEELLSFPSTIGVKEFMRLISQYKELQYD